MADLDAKMPRGIEAKSLSKEDTKLLRHYGTKVVSEINFVNNCEEHESIVGWAYQPNNETVFVSENMLHILSEGEKEVVNELERILQPQERGWQKLLQIFRIPLSRISNTHYCSQRTATSSLGEVVPQNDVPLLKETVYSQLTTHKSLKKSAFTLAEVLITLGIIGVVAALTIPNVVSNYKKKVVETRLAKLYSVLNQAVELSEEKNGACTTWEWGDVDKARNSEFLEYWWKTYMADYIPNVDSVKTPNNSGSTGGYMVFFKDGTGLRIEAIVSQYIWVVIYVNPKFNKQKFVSGAYRDLVSMVSGRDYFSLYLWPERGCSFDLHFYNNLSRSELIEGCKNPYPYGAHCLYLIKNNGWKIPDDYPIKF